MNVLYLDCASGISGDMTVAAMLDMGASLEHLKEVLSGLDGRTFGIDVKRVKKAGIDCCDFDVKLLEDNHDHDMEYLYGHEHSHEHHHEHSHEHHHEHSHEHHHEHSHEHHHEHRHEHHHEHRGMKEIIAILASLSMSDEERNLARGIFDIIAQAEAKAHGINIEEVHFHEVGAMDSIIDIVSAAVCFIDIRNKYKISSVIIPYLSEGSGTIRCAHGILPIPVPATLNIAKEHGLKLKNAGIQGELVTPTGAAIAAALLKFYPPAENVLPQGFEIEAAGYGAGKRQYELPGILRTLVIKDAGVNAAADRVVSLKTNIDDSTGEELGHLMEVLFENGAKDVFYTPVFMKKNRPAYMLEVICSEDKQNLMELLIFKNSTTIGIRKCVMERSVLKRETVGYDTPYGVINGKKVTFPDGSTRIYPEYGEAALLARENGVSCMDVLRNM